MTTVAVESTTQYLTFRLGEEVFALDIAQVREVLDYPQITRVPRMPGFVRGVTNLRGAVVPVVDMHLKFGMQATERTVNSCVIIFEVDLAGERTVLGALADSVQEVIDLAPGQIEPAPRIGASLSTEFIRGMGRSDDQFVIILDIDRAFSSDDLSLVHRAGESNEAHWIRRNAEYR
jgi:purine-binding chemotaxis protein CheW